MRELDYTFKSVLYEKYNIHTDDIISSVMKTKIIEDIQSQYNDDELCRSEVLEVVCRDIKGKYDAIDNPKRVAIEALCQTCDHFFCASEDNGETRHCLKNRDMNLSTIGNKLKLIKKCTKYMIIDANI